MFLKNISQNSVRFSQQWKQQQMRFVDLSKQGLQIAFGWYASSEFF